jgi:putative ABC transport system permease protein
VAGLLRVDPGFNRENVLTLRVPLDFSSYSENQSISSFHSRLRARLAALPGVTGVGAVNALPLAAPTNQTSVEFPGAPGNAGDREQDRPLIDWFVTSPDYFDAMQISVVEGREFDDRDGPGAPMRVIIDETLARRFFPGTSAVGRTANLNDTTVTIVGVVRHARFYNVHSDDRGQVYVPAAQMPFLAMSYAIRTARDPMAMLPAVRKVLSEQDAGVPIANAQTLASIVRTSLGRQRLSLWLLGGFASGAMVLAIMGIYGVVANTVVRRTREFGLRLALGAESSSVLRLVLIEGSRLIVLGLVLGIGGALLVTRVLGNLLFGLQAWDPITFGSVALGLAAAAYAACIIPGWRAARIPPAEALRTE